MPNRAIFVLVLLLSGISLKAQSWDKLRELNAGDRIRVVDSAGETHSGAFAAFSDSAISLTTGSGESAIERARVRRVQVRSGSRRGRNALIGAGVGVAIGVIADRTLGAFSRNETGESAAARAITYVAPIAVFGGLGAAFPGYRTVYRAH